MICEYGCGRIGQYKQTNGKLCCMPFYSQCPGVREKNINGLLLRWTPTDNRKRGEGKKK